MKNVARVYETIYEIHGKKNGRTNIELENSEQRIQVEKEIENREKYNSYSVNANLRYKNIKTSRNTPIVDDVDAAQTIQVYTKPPQHTHTQTL